MFFPGNKVIQTLLSDMSSEALTKINAGAEWTQSNYPYLTQPLICAVLVTIFSMTINYFDSDVPGVCPPTPFSPRKAHQYVIIGIDVNLNDFLQNFQ